MHLRWCGNHGCDAVRVPPVVARVSQLTQLIQLGFEVQAYLSLFLTAHGEEIAASKDRKTQQVSAKPRKPLDSLP